MNLRIAVGKDGITGKNLNNGEISWNMAAKAHKGLILFQPAYVSGSRYVGRGQGHLCSHLKAHETWCGGLLSDT